MPKIYLLNLLPAALLVTFTYFATNRAWLGFLIPSVLLFVMDFVNYSQGHAPRRTRSWRRTS